MNYILPLLSVLLGYVIAIGLKPKGKQNLKLLLAFSGSFLLSLTVMHLLPDVYESHNLYVGIYIMVGILFQIILEFFSKGLNTVTYTVMIKSLKYHGSYSLVCVFTLCSKVFRWDIITI
jgi:hypothetical protein